ncbi:hypothetical protein Tco_1417858 [Tanacetum coccineum]
MKILENLLKKSVRLRLLEIIALQGPLVVVLGYESLNGWKATFPMHRWPMSLVRSASYSAGSISISPALALSELEAPSV